MENQVRDNVKSLFDTAGDYLETRIDLYQLKAIDKSSDVLSSIISKSIIFLVFVMFVFIINIGIALWLGDLLGRSYYGFFILAGFYFITGLICFSMRKKWFKIPITDLIIKKLLK